MLTDKAENALWYSIIGTACITILPMILVYLTHKNDSNNSQSLSHHIIFENASREEESIEEQSHERSVEIAEHS